MDSTPVSSSPALLALHGVRLLGMADADQVAGRFGLQADEVRELLLDFQAAGWITRVEFADLRAWTLTETGRGENERQLAEELTAARAGDVVRAAYRGFIGRNSDLLRASTDWQIRPSPTDPLAQNNHADHRWDSRVLHTLADLALYLRQACSSLSGRLQRLNAYDVRFAAALARAEQGDHSWVNKPRADSCHTVWMEMHEDLLATLNVQRGQEQAKA